MLADPPPFKETFLNAVGECSAFAVCSAAGECSVAAACSPAGECSGVVACSPAPLGSLPSACPPACAAGAGCVAGLLGVDLCAVAGCDACDACCDGCGAGCDACGAGCDGCDAGCEACGAGCDAGLLGADLCSSCFCGRPPAIATAVTLSAVTLRMTSNMEHLCTMCLRLLKFIARS